MQLAGGTAALRFGLCTPAALAEAAATTSGGGSNSSKSLLTRAAALPRVYHSALQLELWLFALLERAMPPRLARLQRLTPSEDACLLQGFMERRGGGGLLGSVAASHHRSWFVVAGHLLYEYRISQSSSSSGGGGSSSSRGGAHHRQQLPPSPPQPTPATLHMIVPLVGGLRFALASDTVLRVTRGGGFQVIKSTYTGPAEGGPVIEHQALAESRKEELVLAAPDAVAARQWLAVLAHAVVDDEPTTAPPPRNSIGKLKAVGPLPEVALPPSHKPVSPSAAQRPLERRLQSFTESFMGGGNSSGNRSPRSSAGKSGATTTTATVVVAAAAAQLPPQRALADPRRRRSCQLYVPFEPEVTLAEVEALARTIAMTQAGGHAAGAGRAALSSLAFV